jgi:Spy/CpxP family protein refolding chaperone
MSGLDFARLGKVPNSVMLCASSLAFASGLILVSGFISSEAAARNSDEFYSDGGLKPIKTSPILPTGTILPNNSVVPNTALPAGAGVGLSDVEKDLVGVGDKGTKSSAKAANAEAHRVPAGSEMVKRDPLKIYRESGIDSEQEQKIRRLAKEFEDQQRVRLRLLGNMLKDMRSLELEPAPDEDKVMSKQGEINKVQNEINNERIKLLLAIRNVLTVEQKQRLVSNIQRLSGQ